MEENLRILLCEDDENLGMLLSNISRQKAIQQSCVLTVMQVTKLF